jgi:uncharacterized membrane protein (DUF2068 family)
MNRSGGVTFSAVLFFIAGGFQLLTGLFFGVVFLIGASTSFSDYGDMAHFIRAFIIAIAVFMIALGCLAIATGMGLLRLRNWARISTIVFAALILFVSLPGLAMIPILPLNNDPQMPTRVILGMRIGLGVFYGLQCALGGWWLYYMNSRGVKAQFGSAQVLSAPPVSQTYSTLADFPDLPPSPAAPRRPVSITIIAVLLLIGAVAAPLGLLMMRALQLPPYPTPFMGFGLQGWGVACFAVSFCILSSLAGIGLLKLRLWGRTLAILCFSFSILNSVVNFLHPGPMIRMQKIIQDAMMPNLSASPAFDISRFTQYQTGFGFGLGMILAVVEIWFVWKEKPAFVAANRSASANS